LEEQLRSIVREEVARLLDERLPRAPAAPQVVFERVAIFAKRIAVSERTGWSLVSKGMPTIGSGRGRRVDVARALEWLRREGQRVDDAVERSARAAARRAAARKAAGA
jgi:hypothetical protein